MRKVRVRARNPMEFVVVMSHLEGCPHFTYNEYVALRQDCPELRMVALTVSNPGRPQLDELIYVASSTMERVAAQFRYI